MDIHVEIMGSPPTPGIAPAPAPAPAPRPSNPTAPPASSSPTSVPVTGTTPNGNAGNQGTGLSAILSIQYPGFSAFSEEKINIKRGA